MPALEWLGKKAVIHHHREVPYRLVHCEKALSVGENSAQNLLVEGDNLEALKALLPYYAGKVKCIYIDPPYNTGNEGWVYNDNVNSPEIKAWLGKVVAKEGEYLSRHDKWLCMMYPRLRLLRDFLRDDGVIFVSIDDNEVHHLRILMDEIFGKGNFLELLIWKNGRTVAEHFSRQHEYIFAFAKSKSKLPYFAFVGDDTITDRTTKKISVKNPASPIKFPKGIKFDCEDKVFPNKFGGSEVVTVLQGIFEAKDGKLANDVTLEAGWAMRDMIQSWLDGDEVFDQKGQKVIDFYFKGNGILQYIKEKGTIHPLSIVTGFSNKEGSSLLEDIMGKTVFDFPKPKDLIVHLLENVTTENDLILDSFAGSGTTGHAVMQLNKNDGGNRQFILIEMNKDIAHNVTAERLKRVSKGYVKANKEQIEGLEQGFRYCTLGVPLFDEYGDISDTVTFPDFAAHIFFSETGVPLPQKAKQGDAYLGEFQNKAIYLLFSQDEMGRKAIENTLNPHTLARISAYDGQRVVYAEGCTLSKETLLRENITFKQVPYAIAGL